MSGFIKKRLLFLQEKIQENKKLKGDDLWKDLINGIHEDIKKEKLTANFCRVLAKIDKLEHGMCKSIWMTLRPGRLP